MRKRGESAGTTGARAIAYMGPSLRIRLEAMVAVRSLLAFERAASRRWRSPKKVVIFLLLDGLALMSKVVP